MNILAIDTATDETSAAVTENTEVLSNIVWSQASLHNKWGGVVPSLAQRAHGERIDWVINKSLVASRQSLAKDIGAVAVTVGPGLAVSLEVGISYARQLCKKFKKPLIAVNHVEGHLLSPLASAQNQKSKIKNQNFNFKFPILGLVASGGTTQLIKINKIGNYEILAQTIDDALGEALDKAARMLGLGYPGGAILEKFAKEGDPNSYPLPTPMLGKEERLQFSFSGLKTAMYKLVEQEKPLSKDKIYNLAAGFQDKAFRHLENIIKEILRKNNFKEFFLTGGVAANIELRRRLRKICKNHGLTLRIPYTKKLCTDNAAMIGITAYFKHLKKDFVKNIDGLDRLPRARMVPE